MTKLVLIKRWADGCYDYSSDAYAATFEAETLEEARSNALRDAEAELSDHRGEAGFVEATPELYLVQDDLSSDFVAELHELWDARKAKLRAEAEARAMEARRATAQKRVEKLRAEIAAFEPSEQLRLMEEELAKVEALLERRPEEES